MIENDPVRFGGRRRKRSRRPPRRPPTLPKHDLDTMGQAKVGTAWHQDRVEQLALLTRSLTRRGVLN
jgi:hypothetical protein